jgi:hypothetical protein
MKKQKVRDNLKINILQGKFKCNRVRKYGHILRMNKEKIPQNVLKILEGDQDQEGNNRLRKMPQGKKEHGKT